MKTDKVDDVGNDNVVQDSDNKMPLKVDFENRLTSPLSTARQNIITLTHGVEPTLSPSVRLTSAPRSSALPSTTGRPLPNTPEASSSSPTQLRSLSTVTTRFENPVAQATDLSTMATISPENPTPASTASSIITPEPAADQLIVSEAVPKSSQLDSGAIVGLVILILGRSFHARHGLSFRLTNRGAVGIGLAVGGWLALKKFFTRRKNKSMAPIGDSSISQAPSSEMARSYPYIAGQLEAIANRVEQEGDQRPRSGDIERMIFPTPKTGNEADPRGMSPLHRTRSDASPPNSSLYSASPSIRASARNSSRF